VDKQSHELNGVAKIYFHTYKPDLDKDTCKTDFIFEIEEEESKAIIKNLTIDGEKGCIGHNKSMSILIRDRAVEDIPIEELKEAGCRKASSCSQELAEALQELIVKKNQD
jgi:hypothetical protein